MCIFVSMYKFLCDRSMTHGQPRNLKNYSVKCSFLCGQTASQPLTGRIGVSAYSCPAPQTSVVAKTSTCPSLSWLKATHNPRSWSDFSRTSSLSPLIRLSPDQHDPIVVPKRPPDPREAPVQVPARQRKNLEKSVDAPNDVVHTLKYQI